YTRGAARLSGVAGPAPAAGPTPRINRAPSRDDRTMTLPSFALVARDTPEACEAKARLAARYGTASLDEAAVIVALGGDGLMLETLHRFIDRGLPIYGMNCGTVGFMMNQYSEDGLPERVARAQQVTLHPLRMHADT